MTHWWARCERPALCGWESRCWPSRAAAVGSAGQHMRRHHREGLAKWDVGSRVQGHVATSDGSMCGKDAAIGRAVARA